MTTIFGPRTPAHLQGYLASLDLELGDAAYERLEEVSRIRLGAPHADVLNALGHRFDGDRSLLDTKTVVI